jgi:type IX secretion system PorP/SprF family membrane protein
MSATVFFRTRRCASQQAKCAAVRNTMRRVRGSFALLGIGLMLSGLFFGLNVQAQQDGLQTQHASMPERFNPAATGARDAWSFLASYRHQWSGVEQAPRTAFVQAHGTLPNERLAFGLSVLDDRQSISNLTSVMGSYAYRLPLEDGTLSMGIQAGAVFSRVRAAEAFAIDPDDMVLAENLNAVLPDVAVGIYYRDDRFHAGLAGNHLLGSRFADGRILESDRARLRRHLYAHGGVRIPVADPVELRPSVLIKYVAGAPFQAEFDLSARWLERFWTGVNYRSGGSIDFHASVHPSPTTQIGYAYDWVLGGLSPYTGGSHEIFLRVDLHLRGQSAAPRSDPVFF